MKELSVNCCKGVNDIFFGMSSEEVAELAGAAEKSTNYTGINTEDCKCTEVRGKISYFYEKGELACISGELSTPFILDGEKIPFTLFEAIRFLKGKSHINMRFADIMSYIFADLGIVIYPYTTIDIEAGIKSTMTTQRLALCNKEVLRRYFHTFTAADKQNVNELNGQLVKQIGHYLEEFDEEEKS